MPQYYDNQEFDFESNGGHSDENRPGCYPKQYCPPPCPPQQPTQVAGAQTAPAQSPMLCIPVGAGAQSPLVAGAQSPYNFSPYGGGGGGFPGYPPYPFYPGIGVGYGWVWAVVVIVVILLIICGCWWWYGGWR